MVNVVAFSIEQNKMTSSTEIERFPLPALSVSNTKRQEVVLEIINLNNEGILALQNRNGAFNHLQALDAFGCALNLLRNGVDEEVFQSHFNTIPSPVKAIKSSVISSHLGDDNDQSDRLLSSGGGACCPRVLRTPCAGP